MKVLILFTSYFISVALAQQCSNVGSAQVFYDPTCSTGESLGCNAGGQGQNCRFCGFDVYPPCPTTTVSTTTTTTTTTTTKSTTTTTASTTEPTESSTDGQESSTTTTTTTSSNTNGQTVEWEKAPDPIKRKYVDHPVKKTTRLENHTGPLPTNSWYENLLLGKGELIIQMLPIQLQAKESGLVFSNCDKSSYIVQDAYVLQPFIADWTYKTLSPFTARKIKNLKDLSVTVEYTFLTGTMEIPLVQGMPFVTAIYKGLVPELSTVRAILSVKVDDGTVYRNGETTAPGNKFVVNLNSGTYWVIFSSAKISFKILGSDLTATSSTTNTVLKTALLGASDTSALWDAYASGYVESADVSYNVFGDQAELQYMWNVVGSNNVFMFALPHHMQHFVYAQKTGIKTSSIRGDMEGIAGRVWLMRIPLSDISWNARNPIDPSKKQAIIDALKVDQNIEVSAPDPYWFGLEIARQGRLAVIADELGEKTIAANIRQSMKELLAPWLDGTNPDALRYDRTYGGLVTADGLDDAGADFGNGYYNDHHFHYGYHIYAAAAIAKEDPEFYNNYSHEINMYVRDIANPSRTDPYFVFTRHKDWFSWHSWAAGLYEFADNRNQESTSEAINGYYAVAMLGKATNNKDLHDFGRMLTAMEVISTKAYWQMPTYNTNYPEKFRKNLMVGVLWSTKVEYATFFGLNTEFIHGIQFLPFTPMTEEYLDKNFMKEEKEFLDKNVDEEITEDWLGYMIEAKAVVDKENQWNEAQKLTWYHAGSSKTNCFYWIATR